MRCEQFACRRWKRCSWCSRRVTRRSPAQDWSAFKGKLEPLYCGGETRRDSVYNGLVAAMSAVDADDWILVHDAARPCLPKKDLQSLIREARADEIGAHPRAAGRRDGEARGEGRGRHAAHRGERGPRAALAGADAADVPRRPAGAGAARARRAR